MSTMNNRNSSRGKKKFGKNLSKVTKAPAPPNPSAANARTSSSRNGLLLLSTKRAGGGTATAASGGLLASKTPSSPSKKPMQPLGLTTESYTSAHDALLGAVIGASRMTDTQQPPDAWGIAEKQTSSAPEPALAPNGGVSSGVSSYNPDEQHYVHDLETNESPEKTMDDATNHVEDGRMEEEARFKEQKERAAERLRQLEEKMSRENSEAPVPIIVTQRPNHWDGRTDDAARPRTLFDPNNPETPLTPGQETNGEKAERGESPTMDQEYSRTNGAARSSQSRGDDDEQPTQPMIHISNYETRDRGEKNAGPRMLFDPKSGSMVAADAAAVGGRGKKGKPKSRRERVRNGDDADGELDNGKPKRKSRGRDKKRTDDFDGSTKEGSKKRGGKIRSSEDRLPRTCGVLYKRDELGNCVCVDGCESGDLGYGAHSVPGGRVRNPTEYSKFVAQQKAYEQDGGNGLAYGLEGYNDYYGGQNAAYGSPDPEPEMKQKEIDWVKPDEKIELVTGVNDSPTLQATASTWVPSQAALAAAALAKEEEKLSPKGPVAAKGSDDDLEETDDDDDDNPESFVGLGFDPTENMDSVMQSPSVKTKTRDLDPVELTGLSLDGGGESTTRNLFAFGSSTWGTGNAGSDWASPGVSKEGQDKAAGAASFLSLSSGNPWGSSGLSSGFGGGAAMPGSRGAGQGSTGD